jgi:dolichol-phosphate mannosyltransferase
MALPEAEPAGPLLSVVVPTRNEAANVVLLTRRLGEALAGIGHEVCFVDDSDDATPAALEQLAAEHPGVVRYRLRTGAERAGGLSTAVITGLRMAGGRYVCVMDADLQHPPETIPAMLEAARRGADLVVASRYAAGGSRGGLEGAGRRLVSRAATALARLLFSEARRSSDPLAGFFLCRRALLDGIEFRPVGFKILLELLVCVPGLEVRDVPLRFERRHAGDSKATMGQGLLYLRHLRSLFFEVEGSARRWKFALVGGSGLAVFLPLLAVLSGPGHLPALLAFLPAFALSVGWNASLNRLWTFADLRRGRDEALAYLRRALLSGAVMFAVFAALLATRLPVLAAGAIAAVAAMVSNATINRGAVQRSPQAWSRLAVDGGVQAALSRLSGEVGADRAFLLPADGGGTAIPAELLARVVDLRRPALWTEGASHRPQRRSNIDSTSTLLLPVVAGERVLAVVVCQRHAPVGFGPEALATATVAVEGLVAVLAQASLGERPAERSGPVARPSES